MALAARFNHTVRGPVLVSASLRTSPSTSDHFNFRISPFRQPVRRISRIMSAGCCREDRSSTSRSSVR